jgi:uncharacterized MAPEG superfamily protein
MNADTDMQYAFTRAIAGHMFKNYDDVLKVDGEVGNKKVYDPRSYLALAEAAMADRVKKAASDLRGAGAGFPTAAACANFTGRTSPVFPTLAWEPTGRL